MALTTVDFKTTFNYVPATKVFLFEDTVNYSGQSVNINNAVGVIKVVAPNGATVYNNTNFGSPDINPGTSRLNTTTIPIPLMGDGTVMQGEYTFTYKVRYTDGTLASAYEVSSTKYITIDYSSPEVSLGMSYSCTTPIISSVDNTSYTKNLVTPTITRLHKIYYPASLSLSPISGTGATVSTSTFYAVANQSIQYSATLTSTLSYNLGNDFYISDSVAGNGYIDVLCDNSLCSIYCALRAQYNRWQNLKGTGQRETEEKAKFYSMMSIAQLAGIAIDCGKSSQVEGYVDQIKAIGNFNDDCSCGDSSEPTLVVGLGSAGTIVVDAGSGISVSAATGGSSTTYTVALESSLLTKLNASYNSVVSAGNGISIAVATAADGTKTYTVTNTFTQTQPNSVDSIKTITLASGALPVIASESAKTYGTTLQDVTLEANYDTSVSSWQNNPAFFTISNFFTGASANFYPSVDIIYSLKTGFSLNPYTRPYVAEIINYDATTIQFRLTHRATGAAVTGFGLDSQYSSLKILIKILS